MNTKTLHVLELSSSGRQTSSVTRQLGSDLIDALENRHGAIEVTSRNLGDGLAFVDEAWIEANFTPDEDRTDRHKNTLAFSDELVAELKNADVVVIGAPVYNFSIPASLKAWIDMIARARLTFRYTENGPVGMLEGKKVFVIVASGGVPIGSPMDFATPYLRHALSFVGITDLEFIAAERINSDAEGAMDTARARIAELVHLPTIAA